MNYILYYSFFDWWCWFKIDWFYNCSFFD